MQRSKKQLLINFGLLLAGIIFGLFMGEIFLRILKPPQLSIERQPCFYVEDEIVGYRYMPNAKGMMSRNFEIDNLVEINSEGFHDIEHLNWQHKEASNVLVLGDSFTAALQVSISQGWTQTLQRELSDAGHPHINVINLGLDGTGTDIHLAILKEYLPLYRPKLVILAFFVNDAEDILSERKFRECYKDYVLVYQDETQKSQLKAFVDTYKPGNVSVGLFNNLYVFRATTFLCQRGVLLQSNFLTPSKTGMVVAEKTGNPRNMDDLLQEFVNLSKQHNFRLLVIPVPSRNDLAESFIVLQNAISDITLTQLKIIDVSPSVQYLLARDNKSLADLFWTYDAHLNAYGNHIFGMSVADAAKEYLQLPEM